MNKEEIINAMTLEVMRARYYKPEYAEFISIESMIQQMPSIWETTKTEQEAALRALQDSMENVEDCKKSANYMGLRAINLWNELKTLGR